MSNQSREFHIGDTIVAINDEKTLATGRPHEIIVAEITEQRHFPNSEITYDVDGYSYSSVDGVNRSHILWYNMPLSSIIAHENDMPPIYEDDGRSENGKRLSNSQKYLDVFEERAV